MHVLRIDKNNIFIFSILRDLHNVPCQPGCVHKLTEMYFTPFTFFAGSYMILGSYMIHFLIVATPALIRT